MRTTRDTTADLRFSLDLFLDRSAIAAHQPSSKSPDRSAIMRCSSPLCRCNAPSLRYPSQPN